METLKIQTGLMESLNDITDQVLAYVEKSKIAHGFLILQTPDNDCSVIGLSCEEKKAQKDYIKRINNLFPIQDGFEFNGFHMKNIRSSFIGTSKVYLIEGGSLVLGAYERIFLADFRGPSPDDGRLVIMDTFGEALSGEAALPESIASYNKAVVDRKEKKDREEAEIIEEMKRERAERIRLEKEAREKE